MVGEVEKNFAFNFRTPIALCALSLRLPELIQGVGIVGERPFVVEARTSFASRRGGGQGLGVGQVRVGALRVDGIGGHVHRIY